MKNTDVQATELYQRTILEHCKSPRFYGDLPRPTHAAKGHNPICGDVVRVTVEVADSQVLALQFTAQSCALCKASASIMCESLQCKHVHDAQHQIQSFLKMIQGDEAVQVDSSTAFFSVVRSFPARAKCVALPWQTLRSALAVQARSDGEPVVSTEAQG